MKKFLFFSYAFSKSKRVTLNKKIRQSDFDLWCFLLFFYFHTNQRLIWGKVNAKNNC